MGLVLQPPQRLQNLRVHRDDSDRRGALALRADRPGRLDAEDPGLVTGAHKMRVNGQQPMTIGRGTQAMSKPDHRNFTTMIRALSIVGVLGTIAAVVLHALTWRSKSRRLAAYGPRRSTAAPVPPSISHSTEASAAVSSGGASVIETAAPYAAT